MGKTVRIDTAREKKEFLKKLEEADRIFEELNQRILQRTLCLALSLKEESSEGEVPVTVALLLPLFIEDARGIIARIKSLATLIF